jgi:hypothetical protein
MTLITLIYTDQKKLTDDCADERGSEGKNLTQITWIYRIKK